MALAFGGALGYLITSRATGQPSPPQTWPVWPYYLCGVMFAVGALLYAAAHGMLPRLRRPDAAVKVTILETDWKDWRLSHLIVAVRVRVENMTKATVRLAPVFWMETDPRNISAPVEREDPGAIRKDIASEQATHSPSLFDRLEIPAGDSTSGWVVRWVRRTDDYGKPGCWLILRDEIGNKYPVRIEPER